MPKEPDKDLMLEPHLYAVFGSPIAHSRSPDIHRMFARQTGEDLIYTKQEVQPAGFEQACREFFELGGSGLNITLPLKENAFQFADRLTTRARLAGAVNTLKLEQDRTILGDNTDGCGLVRDLTVNQEWPLKDKRILILGAGGAVRGVLGPLLDQGPKEILVANRTAEKARQLAHLFEAHGPVRSCGLDAIPREGFDLIINGTSMSLGGEAPPLTAAQLGPETACYDMAYGAEPTAFLRWAGEHGVTRLADGLGMLVEQAAESFNLWRGVMPDTKPVIEALRN
ncbi:shikimate dehydrogenase [Gilvimarinus sp. F26214L]|uniref:shikimate dehydrogenase n=1 Tax=Gilvimarinus sp. DZF01 TaxID=3461371 RepID=UPI004045D551